MTMTHDYGTDYICASNTWHDSRMSVENLKSCLQLYMSDCLLCLFVWPLLSTSVVILGQLPHIAKYHPRQVYFNVIKLHTLDRAFEIHIFVLYLYLWLVPPQTFVPYQHWAKHESWEESIYQEWERYCPPPPQLSLTHFYYANEVINAINHTQHHILIWWDWGHEGICLKHPTRSSVSSVQLCGSVHWRPLLFTILFESDYVTLIIVKGGGGHLGTD